MLVGGGRGYSQVVLVVKNLHANSGDIRDSSPVSGLGRSPGRGHGRPFQYFCLKNPMDRGTWWATVHAELDMTEASWHVCVCVACFKKNFFSLILKFIFVCPLLCETGIS